MTDQREITVPGGVVQVLLAGAGDSWLIYHHGTPGAGPMEADMVEAATSRGFRIAQIVRPGYGSSSRQPGRRIVDVVPLVTAVADALGAERFVSMGWSGGGPHVLATAALLPDRCAAALCLAGVAPYGVPDLDFLAGMGEDNIVEFSAALEGETALRSMLEGAAAELANVTGESVIEALRSLLPAADQEMLTGDRADHSAMMLRWSIANGVDGWLDDDIAFTHDWGFDLKSIRVPVQIWQGSDDLMVPAAHGHWLAGRVPGASVRLLEGEGHMSIAKGAFTEGFDALRAALQPRTSA